MTIRRMNDPNVCFQTGHTKGNGSGINMTGKAYSLETVNGGEYGRDGCWAWKHRQLMSFPKKDLADPVTATDYKDPDMVGWYEE